VSVGGSSSVVAGGLEPTSTAVPSTGSYPVTPGGPIGVGFDDSYLVSTTHDADSFLYESGLLDSPNSSAFEDDHFIGDYTKNLFPGFSGQSEQPTFDSNIDFNDYLNDFSTHEQLQQQHTSNDGAVSGSSLPNPPTENSPKDPILQSQLRASLVGCDV
jgi:hypothetical protein